MTFQELRVGELRGLIAEAKVHLIDRDCNWKSRETKAGRLASIRPGSFLVSSTWTKLSRRDQHKLLAIETAERFELLFSHRTAAVLHGLPILGKVPKKLEVTTSERRGGESKHVRRYGAQVPPEADSVAGLHVTTPARTVIDIARTEPFHSALVTADAALFRELVTLEQLEEEVDHARGRRGYRKACLVLDYANGLAESPGESLSRARMIQLGAPIPDLQFVVRNERGEVLGRVDFYWTELGIIGEFDGAIKYDGPPEKQRDVLLAERRREQKLRELSKGLIRWEWKDAFDIWPLGRKLQRIGLIKGELRLRPVRPLRAR